MSFGTNTEQTPEKSPLLSEVDSLYLFQLIKDRSGIVLTQEKGYLIESRLLPIIRESGFKNLSELVGALRSGRSGLATQVINAIVTHETYFYRDQKPFDILKQSLFPTLLAARQKNPRILRIWCAASSSGQEPYTIAFLWKDMNFPEGVQKIEIFATDISAPVIDRAKIGTYSQFEVQRGLPIQTLVKYFKQVDGEWQIDASIRAMVKFQVHNLLDDPKSFGKFDVILCRNVLIYFDPPTKGRILQSLSQTLQPEGYLMLGGSETVLGITDIFESMEGLRGVYKLNKESAKTV
jgi:chemotaxis protein methyltransferase CheR